MLHDNPNLKFKGHLATNLIPRSPVLLILLLYSKSHPDHCLIPRSP